MQLNPKSIRPFIGAKDYDVSRNFYNDLGFEEVIISHDMSLFKLRGFSFYLQDAYVKDWIDNSMLFLEVENPEELLTQIKQLALEKKYKGVRLSEMVYNDWGKEFFLHDPSGILWHIGAFN